jgi:hypothetical protein
MKGNLTWYALFLTIKILEDWMLAYLKWRGIPSPLLEEKVRNKTKRQSL